MCDPGPSRRGYLRDLLPPHQKMVMNRGGGRQLAPLPILVRPSALWPSKKVIIKKYPTLFPPFAAKVPQGSH